MAARGEVGRWGSRDAWGKACARVGAIHGVGGGSGGGARRRACGVCGMLSPGSSAHGEAAARWQQWQQWQQEREMGRWRRVVL